MAVKMRKWSPRPPPRKFAVAVRLMRLEGLAEDGGDDAAPHKFVAVKIKWKGEPKFFPLMPPFQPRQKTEQSSQKIMKKNCGIVEWDDDLLFENTCCFSVISDKKLGPWEIVFSLLCSDKLDSKAKMAVIGRVSTNISEIASKMESSSIEQRLPLNLMIDGVSKDATLMVLFNFVEIRNTQDLESTSRSKSIDVKHLSTDKCKDNVKARRRSLSLEEVCLDEADESSASEAKDTAAQAKLKGSTTVLESDKKLPDRWFSWKSRRFSFKRAKTKEEKPEIKNEDENETVEPFNDHTLQKDDPTVCLWEEKELISRDGQAKLKAPFFFASFDQRSDKAAGESACTVLVAVISHWLHSNPNAMPNRSVFDNLIMQGSSEWRKLCEDAAYVNDFPNKHFDLETVLRADIRPVSISHNESFVGFFGAGMFETLKGAMSFEDIWNEISSNASGGDTAPGIYIVSWNDHFFVLKAEADAYYIIDTLGERLHEGCYQAYIIRFDDTTIMQRQTEKQKAAKTSENENMDEIEQDEVICRGKECCREFIKRFLAAIPLKELEEEEKKSVVSYFSLHQRLQIEFNYSCLTSPASSSASSPFSSLTTSTSSPLSE